MRVACVCFVKRGLTGAAPKNPCVTSCGFGGATSNPRRGGGDQAFIWNLDSNDVTRPLLRRLRSRSSPDTGMYNTYVEVELIVYIVHVQVHTYHSLLRICGLVTWNWGRGGVLIRCTVWVGDDEEWHW